MSKRHSFWVVLSVVVCVAAGMAIEHVRLSVLTPDPADRSDDENVRPPPQPRIVKVRDEKSEREAAALRQRVRELEQVVAEQTQSSTNLPAQVVAAQPREATERGERPRGQSFTERMEQLRQENPDQYAEMQKRREEFRQRMEQREQDRANFLTAVDVQNMGDQQRENHEKLLATVARVNELMAQMGQPGAERNSEARRELGETYGLLNELYGEERRYLLEETARSVGYEGAQASEFAEHMQEIIDNTTMMPSGFGRRGGNGRDNQPRP